MPMTTPGSIPSKTDKGRHEVQARSDVLSAVQRRLLILADGHRTVNDLGAFVRVGELDGALGYLLQFGYLAIDGAPALLQGTDEWRQCPADVGAVSAPMIPGIHLRSLLP